MPRPKRASSDEFYVAKHGFNCEIDGVRYDVMQGERARAGHVLLRFYSEYFEPVSEHVKYDVEQATAAPGELRGERSYQA